MMVSRVNYQKLIDQRKAEREAKKEPAPKTDTPPSKADGKGGGK